MSDEETKNPNEEIRKLQIRDAEKEKRIKRLEDIVDVQQASLLHIRKQIIRTDEPGVN